MNERAHLAAAADYRSSGHPVSRAFEPGSWFEPA
jgi:hypothetical protein